MTNDTNTLNGALQELGETIADNLVSMGVVDADASDGLTTLAGKILTIEPSIGGLDLDTAITLTSSSASITLGGSVVLTSKLTASYDDETLVNVDLEGVLTGATVSFMDGNTVIGTDVTDSNGVATYTYTPAATGTLSLKAVFAGTDNFDDCESSAVTVSVIAVPDSISLSADKSVLSYYDGESATLSATVLDANSQPCSGETVEFFNGSTSMGTATTNSSGIATKTYSSTGVGDVTFTAEVGNLVSETYSLEDCTYYNPTQSSGTKTFNVPLPSTFTLTYILKQGASNYSSPYLDIGDSTNNRMLVGQYARAGGNGLIVYKTSSTTYAYSTNIPTNQENIISFTYDGTNYSYSLNNGTPLVVEDKGVTLTKLIHQEGATTQSNYIKNIKIKPL